MAELLTIGRLCLRFGGLRALDEVDVSITQGHIAGLIGPNGAGKTSLLNCICRFYQPQSGTIKLDGVDLLRVPTHGLAKRGLTRTFQHMELFAHMTVLENVLVGVHPTLRPTMIGEAFSLPGARRTGTRQRERAEETLDLMGLSSWAATPVQSLPLGIQKRTGVARALAARPRILLLDEPAGGLNGTEKRDLAALLRDLRAKLDLTILLIEHDMDMVMSLCDEITVLDFGRRIAAGTPAEIRRDPTVIAAYLGTPEAGPPSVEAAVEPVR